MIVSLITVWKFNLSATSMQETVVGYVWIFKPIDFTWDYFVFIKTKLEILSERLQKLQDEFIAIPIIIIPMSTF